MWPKPGLLRDGSHQNLHLWGLCFSNKQRKYVSSSAKGVEGKCPGTEWLELSALQRRELMPIEIHNYQFQVLLASSTCLKMHRKPISVSVSLLSLKVRQLVLACSLLQGVSSLTDPSLSKSIRISSASPRSISQKKGPSSTNFSSPLPLAPHHERAQT